MPTIGDVQWLPPDTWQKFEDICCDLWREIWKDPYTQKNGRNGQPQHGVDVYGRPNSGEDYHGIQCKGKDDLCMNSVTESELIKEVEKAKEFNPPIKAFILATTGPSDGEVQKVARELTVEHLRQGLFSVTVLGWDQIRKLLAGYEGVLRKHYKEFFVTTEAQKDQHLEVMNIVKDKVEEMSVSVSEIQKAAERPGVLAADTLVTYLESEHNAEVKYAKKLIDEHKPKQALTFLQDLKDRVWDSAGNNLRFKILADIATSLLRLGRNTEAGKLFVEALQYKPDDEKALANAALGHYLLSDRTKASELIKKVKGLNSTNTIALVLEIEMADPKTPIDEIVEAIPEGLRENPEIAYSIAAKAFDRRDAKTAEKWYKIAMAHDKENLPDLKGSCGSAIIRQIVEVPLNLEIESILVETEERIKESITLLTDAWDSISETDLRSERFYWLIDRAVAKKLLRDLRGAASDLELALSVKPSDTYAVKQRALIANDMKDPIMAIDLLRSIVDKPETPEVPLLLADILKQEKKGHEAIDVLNKHLATKPKLELAQNERALLVRWYLEQGDITSAEAKAAEIRQEDPSCVRGALELAVVAKAKGKESDAVSFLREAVGLLSKDTPFFDKYQLADELYYVHLFDEAVKVYETIVDPSRNNHLTHKLIHCYHMAGNSSEALDLCKTLRIKYGAGDRYLSELESTINEVIGDLNEAQSICVEYLKVHPDDNEMKVRLATIFMRGGNAPEAEQTIEGISDTDLLKGQYRKQLIGLLVSLNKFAQALEIAYEARRKYSNEPEEHLMYIQLVLSRSEESDLLSAPTAVALDSAVTLVDPSGSQLFYIIDDRKDADPLKGEFNSTHEISKRLIGKKVGAEVDLKQNLFDPQVERITEIKSKYTHAFQYSLDNFERLFPGHPGIHSFKTDPDGDATKFKDKLVTILESTSVKPQTQDLIEKTYKQHRITIGGLSGLTGKNVLETCGWLSANKTLGVICASGAPEDLNLALTILSQKPALVLDPTALFAIHFLSVGDVIKKTFDRLLVSQSTIDLLNQIVDKMRVFDTRVVGTIFIEQGTLYRQEMPQEEKGKTLARIKSLLEWVRKNCALAISKKSLSIGPEEKQSLDDTFGQAFMDSVLVSAAENSVLFSDDLALRMLASNQYQVRGVWTQALLLFLHKNGVFDEKSYNEVVVKLATWHYYHTSINAEVLIEAARQSDWLPKFTFIEVLYVLAGECSSQETAVTVAANFIYELWKLPILSERRDQIVFEVLNAITLHRNRKIVLAELDNAVMGKFYIWSTAQLQFQKLVRYWKMIHPV